MSETGPAAPPAGGTPLDGLVGGNAAPLEEVQAAAIEEAQVSEDRAYGRLGQPLDRRSPFWIGMTAAFGVAVTFVSLWAVYAAHQVLLLLVVALFIAAGLDPVVAWLQRRGLPRGLAVAVVVLAGLVVLGGVLDLVVPVVVKQVTQLVNHLPRYAAELKNRSSFIGRMNSRYHIEAGLKKYLTSGSGSVATGVLGVGKVVLGAVTSTVVVVVVTIYLLADLPRVKRTLFQFAPRSRRARVVVLGEEMFAKVGGYVLGNLAISVITGVGTWVWCVVLGVPYPLLLAVIVAIFDLVPVVGSTIGGIIVALVALTVSVPVAGATAGFYLLYRLLEDYLLSPRIMRRTVAVPGLVTVVATLVGGTMLGIIGALIAIPVAAAVKLLVEEVAGPRLDRS